MCRQPPVVRTELTIMDEQCALHINRPSCYYLSFIGNILYSIYNGVIWLVSCKDLQTLSLFGCSSIIMRCTLPSGVTRTQATVFSVASFQVSSIKLTFSDLNLPSLFPLVRLCLELPPSSVLKQSLTASLSRWVLAPNQIS